MDCVNGLGKAYTFPSFVYSTRLSFSPYSSLPHEVEPEAPAPAAVAPAPPPVVAARAPLRDISPPPSPPLFPQHDDDMDVGVRRRRVPEPSSSTALNVSSSRNISGNIQGRAIIGLPRGRRSDTSTTASNDNKHISQSEELDLDLEINGERQLSTAKLMSAASRNNTTSHHFNKHNDPDDVIMDVENLDFNFSPTMRQATRLYRPSPSTSVDIPLKVQLQQQQDNSFDFDLLDEIDPDQNQPPVQQKPSSAALPSSRNLKGKGRAEPCSSFVDQPTKSLSKIDDASSDDYGMMGIDDNDFADVEFLENLDRVEMEALGSGDTNGAYVSSTAGGVGLPSSSVSMGGPSGSGSSYVFVDGDKKTSSSASVAAPIISSSSSTKPIERLEIIEIGSSDEDDEMLGTDEKENEPVATRHVKRRTEDLDEGVKERGRGLFASQAWNPVLSGGARKTGSSQNQNQNRSQNGSQGLKSRVLAMNAEVIDLSDSDDD